MNRLCIALLTLLLAASHLPAQTTWLYPVNFNTQYDELYNLKNFYSYWTSLDRHDPRPSLITGNATPAPPPAAPGVREYHWPDQADTSATFSIVTNGGAEYLATMVWVDGDNLHFATPDGGMRQIPLTSVSRPLTQVANARKDLKLPLPSVHIGEAAPPDSAVGSSSASQLQTKRN